MKPTLPQNDSNSLKRQEALTKARNTYRYNYAYPPEVAMVAEVPKKDHFSPMYIARVGALDLTVLANHVAAKGNERFGEPEEVEKMLQNLGEKVRSLKATDIKNHFSKPSHELALLIDQQRVTGLADYRALFETISEPPIVAKFEGDATAGDQAFAWQRLAGPNPMMLRSVSALPANFPVTDQHFRAACGDRDQFSAALAEGRLFLADYAALEGLPRGESAGYKKFLWAPLALFVRPPNPNDGVLRPVAIQCEQAPGPNNPILTPADGPRWQMARTAVQVADGNVHQGVVHLAHTHLVMEAAIVAAHRQLAKKHPLQILLAPHYEFTLALNEVARTNLIAPGGQVEYVLASTLEGTIGCISEAMKAYRFEDQIPRRELKARGVDNLETLPVYPYRDDALLLWDAVVDWVGSYVRLYYKDDDSVQKDTELQAFWHEFGADDGGRIGGLPTLDNVASLIESIAFLVFTASVQHAAVNFPQFDYMGFVPNLPGAAYAELTGSSVATEADYIAMLPPLGQALRQFDITYQLSHLRDNFLGQYPLLHFHDHRVRKPRAAFVAALEQIEKTITERDRTRFLPYRYLLPSNVPASIHI